MKTVEFSRMLLVGMVALTAGVGLGAERRMATQARPAAARRVPSASVKLLDQEPKAPACGAFRRVEWEACRELAACSASRIDSAQLGPLEAAIEAAHARHMSKACARGACGAADAPRSGENHFACEGKRLCLTRTLTSRCSSEAARAPAADQGDDRARAPKRVRAESRAPARRSPAERGTARPTRAPRDLDEGQDVGDAFDPLPSGSAPSGANARPAAPNRGRAAAGGYSFPARAEHLDPGEYWYWKAPDGHGAGSQQYAYDLTTARFDAQSGQWSECVSDASGKPKCRYCGDAQRNGDCLVYGEPLHAMASGKVIRCWRNAPENPAPGERHPARDMDPPRIGGGGNALVVEHADGSYALYAHMQPGSIPAALCPNNAELMNDANDKSEAAIPEGSQPRVERGQKVGLVGNSGKSGNPHVHVHLQDGPTKSSNGVPLDFEDALIAVADDGDTDWSRLDGRTRPTKTSAIWPDFSKNFPEIAYHGVKSEDYQPLFDHVAGSGYRLDWIDGFELGGRVLFNVVFHPTDGKPWAAVHNLTGAQYQQEYERRKSEGLRLRQVEAYTAGGQVRYAAIFVKDGGPAVKAYHGRSASEHQRSFEEWTAEGWRPRNVSVVSVGGERVYAALYERGQGGIYLKSALPQRDYQEEYEKNREAGRHLSYLDAYEHDGQAYFSAIWDERAPRPGLARHGLSGSEYQSAWEQARHEGLLTRGVTGYTRGGQAQFAAFWRR